MQVFVREHFAMIAAPVQRDVDGIPKGSHDVSVAPIEGESAWEAEFPPKRPHAWIGTEGSELRVGEIDADVRVQCV
jgi:hypothetical protein